MKPLRSSILVLVYLCFHFCELEAQWTAVNTGLPNTWVNALAVSGANLFAGTDSGVFLSTNNGTSWTAASTGLTDTHVWSFAVSGTNLFAGTYGGLFLSINNGTSWTAASTGLTGTYVWAIAVSGTNLFAGIDGGVFLSTNNGTSWTAVNTGLTNPNVRALAVSGMNLFVGTFGGVFLSTNNGTSWTAVNTGLTNTYVWSFAVSGTNLFVGTMGGVFRRSFSDWMLLLAPAYGLGGITPPVTFKWKANPQALAYAFQVSTNTGFSNLVVNQYTTDTTYTVSNLQLATVYYWRVRAENATWASEWGYGSFTTKLASAPQLSSPTSGATLVSVTPTLIWNPVVSTATYTVQVSTRTAFDALVYSKDTTSTSVVLPQLQRLTTYYWRVKAQTVGDTTAWSSVSNFTTPPNAPNKIILVYPDSSKQEAYQNDWLLWQGDTTAATYLVQISQSPLFTSIFDSATVKSAGYRNANKVFTSGSTYFWRVRGSNIGGNGPFSSIWSFRVGSVLRMPVTSYSTSTFAFGKVEVGQYTDTTVTISNNGNDTLKITSVTTTNSVFSARPTVKNLPPGQSFVDTIRYTPGAIGTESGKILILSNAASSPDTIAVTGTGTRATAVEDVLSQIPEKYSLTQNYPNPFNPSTSLQFGLPARSSVHLSIYNTLGQVVAHLVNREYNPGWHQVKWNANVPSGIYFYRLQAGEFVETKKMILLR